MKALLATGAALTLLAYCLLPAASSLAQTTDAAEDLLRRADAQLRLAEIFEQGEGVVVDLARARLHYEQSAHAGSDTAKLRLGQMLVAGLGGPRDTSQGLQLIRSIAGTGNSNAQALLGDLLSGGTLGYLDADGAIAAYQQAANGGSVAAMLSLGDVFRSGAIVAVDLPKSFGYYAAAAAGGSASARLALAEMRASGQGVAQDAASGLATLRAAAAKGDGDAAMALGDLLLAGDAGQIDAAGAIEAYETAATGGRTDAYLRLGDLFRDGYYTRRDAERAVSYYQMAANAGESYGLYALSAGYLDRDFGALGSTAQGLDLVQRAGTAGNQYAVTAIAGAYLFGQGVDADIERGLAILAEAAAAGNTVAALDLVAIYRDGLQRNGKLLLRRHEQMARQTLASVQDQIDRGSYLYQTLLLDAVPDGFADPQKALGQLAELSSRDRRSLVVRLLAVNPNAFVTLIQLRLKHLGHLDTPINGRLNRQTIRAINAYCRLKSAQDICRMGPLSVATARVLSSAF